jgi:hypothetical protein
MEQRKETEDAKQLAVHVSTCVCAWIKPINRNTSISFFALPYSQQAKARTGFFIGCDSKLDNLVIPAIPRVHKNKISQ